MNYRMISYILGWILIFEGLFLSVPMLTAIVYGESVLPSYLIAMGICFLIGGLLVFKKPKKKQLFAREGCVIVALSWIVLSAFGALPFLMTREIPTFIDALFETVSGFTTTGASILSDVEKLSHASLMWRSFTHWVGGMGVLVFIMAFIPLSGAQNMHIMKAESPGPSVSKLVPRVKTTALILYSIYFALTLIEFIMLLFGGMTVFEALTTSFATAGTGGFGFYNSSMGSFSPYLQIVITVFMILFAINFNCYYMLLCGKLREAFNLELRTFLIIIASVITVITINIHGMFSSVEEALRHSAFTVASLISTTGFSTVDFNQWPELSRALLVIIMFIGACAGSTGGGMKVSRLCIMAKTVMKELAFIIHPRNVRKTRFEGKTVEHEVLRSINVFLVAYLGIFVLSVMLISLDNFDFATNFTAVAATLNNIGPGLAKVGPTQNFGIYSNFSKLVLAFDMLSGRLEIFPMLVPVIYLLRKKQLS